MARTKISEFSATAADNTDIDNIDIAEGCAPSGINNAIRELMAQLKDFQTGAAGDPFNGAVNGTVGATTPAAGAFTTLSASSTVSGTGFSNYFASPPAIGGTAAAAGTFTNLAYTGTLTGGTGVINIGSGQVYKDASGNVGIGTTSTAQRLHVDSATSTTAIRVESDLSGSSYFSGLEFIRSSVAAGSIFQSYRNTAVGGVGFVWSTTADNAAEVSGSYTQRMYLDNSGNLGLGVPPSEWSQGKAFELRDVGYGLWNGGSSLYSVANAYFNSGFKYANTGSAASHYYQFQGAHVWSTAPSGTAGNAISFTQAMTLDASGNLSVGTTSNSAKLNIDALTAALAGDFNSTNASGVYLRFRNGGTAIGDVGAAASIVGGSASDFGLNVRSGSLILGTGNTERARIDTSGSLLVGTTTVTQTARLTLKAGTGQAFGVGPLNTSQNNFFVVNEAGTGVYLASGATSWTANSDERIKDIIEPITNAAAKVSGLRAVIGKYKSDEEGTRRSFLIAQDVQAVLPEAVNVQDNEQGTLGLQYTDVIPLLVAAFTELKAEFDAYKAAHP